MKLVSSRSLNDLKPVLMDSESGGPDPVYEVYTDIDEPGWVNKTVLYPGRLGSEYPKTFGHYHSTDKDEIYKVVAGEGFLLKQNEKEVVFIKLKEGVEHTITPQWGHCLINTGSTPLVVLDNWSHGHQESDYEKVTQNHGMGYYLVDQEGQPTPELNPHYPDSLGLSFYPPLSEDPL
jgi:oxalate decarboxylase/phosphoglucose isomerase-like protein (cupin superfamily)